MRKGTTTREAILTAAVETACRSGFSGLSLQPLATRVGLTKSGLYAHFGSKAALQIATLERTAELFQQSVLAPAKTEPAGLARLQGVFGRWLEWPACAGLSGSCPFLAAVVELEAEEGPLRARLVRLFSDFQQVVEQLVGAAMRRGHLKSSTTPAQFAHELLALRYAHHWSAHFMRDPAALERTRAAFAALSGRSTR
jgi:AcrR family transcriptional regulator